jgi:hypothetical protein
MATDYCDLNISDYDNTSVCKGETLLISETNVEARTISREVTCGYSENLTHFPNGPAPGLEQVLA